MKLSKSLCISFSLIAFAGAAAAAGDESKRSVSQTGTNAASPASSQAKKASAVSAQKLIGTDIVDAQGKDMGEIKDVVLNLDTSRVHAAVLEFGGFLGVGEKQYAFPIGELRSAREGDKLMLNINKERLEKDKGFDKDKWPEMSDDYWGRIGKQEKAAGQAGKMNLVRASKLIGRDVQDANGKDIGEIKDVVLSTDRGRIEHVVVDLDGRGEQRLEPKALSLAAGDKVMMKTGASSASRSSAASATKDDKQAAAGASGKRSFSELDKDGDGMLSQLEAAGDANAKSNFEKLDKNNNMKLSREEWDAGQKVAGARK